MSEDFSWNQHWWREEKATSLDRRRRLVAASSLVKPGDSFLIVTEGTVTEPIYFEFLRRDLELPAVRIEIQPGDHSDPRHVIRTAANRAKAQMKKARKGQLGLDEPPEFDHVWAVVDTDVAARMQFWNELLGLAKDRKVSLAHSTPCFEYWLLLHLGKFTTKPLINGDGAKAELRRALDRDYSTNEETTRTVLDSIVPNWPEAVRFSEQGIRYHLDAGTADPANPSTKVGQLVRALNDSALDHKKRLLDRKISK